MSELFLVKDGLKFTRVFDSGEPAKQYAKILSRISESMVTVMFVNFEIANEIDFINSIAGSKQFWIDARLIRAFHKGKELDQC